MRSRAEALRGFEGNASDYKLDKLQLYCARFLACGNIGIRKGGGGGGAV